MTLVGPASFTQPFVPQAPTAAAGGQGQGPPALNATQGRSLSNILGEIEAAMASLVASPQGRR